MPKKVENFNKDLEGFLRASGFNKVVMLDADGRSVPDAGDAEQFKFDYRHGDYNYGTVTITTSGGKVTVYYNETATKTSGGIDSEWTKFLKKLKDWSLRYGQMGFDIQNIDKLGSEMKKRKSQKDEESLLEGYYGGRHTSYSDNVPTIKMVIKHSRPLDESDLRYHHIEKIFLENEAGERVLVPSKKPSIGRAFARHLAEGGEYNDDRWKHIKEIAEDISKLGGFVRATRNGQFNEAVGSVVNEAAEHYISLRETIKRLASSRGYNNYFESWQPTLMEEGGDQVQPGMFATPKLDPRIERAIPVLNKLKIKFTEISEAEEFSAWAEKIAEVVTPVDHKKIEDFVKLLKDTEDLPVGADAMSIKGQLEDLIDDDRDRGELFSELEELASSDPDNDAKPAIISWMQKHRSNDVYSEVLDQIGEEKIGGGGEIATQQQPAKAPAAPPQPAAAPSGTMPAPMAETVIGEKVKAQKQRNFVAKHAQRSGAGKHGGSGYQRHDKHKKKLGEEDVAEKSHDWSPGAKETIKKDKIYSLENLISLYKEKGNTVKVKELEAELKSLRSVEEDSLDNYAESAVHESLGRIKKLSGLK